MSKSNATEIIAILWLIASTQVTGVWHWVLLVLGIENIIESVVFAFLHRESK